MHTIDEKYMLRCIEIAKNGLGTTAPNPMVGAVIVHKGKIIGEGFTSSFGGRHAEVNAINSVSDSGQLKDSTLYVTLEPCSHFGKTPPCADLIVVKGIPSVVIGLVDPNEKVAGQGIQKLKNAGCQVSVGLLEKECRFHHKRFLKFQERRRPHVILKWAQTKDGFIAPESFKRASEPQPFWITDQLSRQLVHRWRSEEQAILVGTNTVLLDNPRLDVRQWSGQSPLRIILDKTLKIDRGFHVLDGSIPTLVLTEVSNTSSYLKGIDYARVDFSRHLASQICTVLYQRNINSVLIEGGAKTLNTFLEADLWDEARVFIGANRFGKGLKAPVLKMEPSYSKEVGGNDLLNVYIHD